MMPPTIGTLSCSGCGHIISVRVGATTAQCRKCNLELLLQWGPHEETGLYHLTPQEIISVNVLLRKGLTVEAAIRQLCRERAWFREKLFRRTGREWKLQLFVPEY